MGKLQSCFWRVCINGYELDLSRKNCIKSLTFDELCDGSDTCTLVISDPNFLIIEDNIFIDDAKVLVEIGWHDDTYLHTFSGYISAIDIDFPEDGYPVLSIFCLDDSHVMNRKKKKRSWDNVTNAEVVQKIAQEYGFKCVIEEGYNFDREDTISQSDLTDIEFCESLVNYERVPFMCKLIGDTLYYVKRGMLKEASASLYYRRYPYDIISFRPRINKETIITESTKSDINTSNKEVDTYTANGDNTSSDNPGYPVNNESGVPSVNDDQIYFDPTTGNWG